MTLPNGYRALWDGIEYEASPDGELVRLYANEPVPGFDLVRSGRFRRLVLASDVDWLGYVRTTATVAGHDAVVLDERAGEALVEYHDPTGWAPGQGPDFGVRRVWLSAASLADRQEHRWPVR
jgi:hypothetical protein